jgi:hypothetical protein
MNTAWTPRFGRFSHALFEHHGCAASGAERPGYCTIDAASQLPKGRQFDLSPFFDFVVARPPQLA